MQNSKDTYIRPATLEEALQHLEKEPFSVAAGCTDLLPATERKVLPGPVLDISAIASLRGITAGPDGVTIGATTTWSDLRTADLPPAFNGLRQAAAEVGALQIQNRGTIAGNLCNASPAADGVPPLLTLDAEVELASKAGTRRLPIGDFIVGPRQTARLTDELVTAIHIPARATNGTGNFLKLGARKYLVISIAMAAARIELTDGIVTDAALALGACGPVATRLPEAEAALTGAPVDPSRITDDHLAPHLSPIDDMRADADYRRAAALELIRRTVDQPVESRAA